MKTTNHSFSNINVHAGPLIARAPRTSDARGGQILADITKDRKVKSVAITYTNNDYGKGLADVYKAAVESHGIKVTTVTAHEDGKADYSSEVATLASAGGDAVAVIGYLDQGGSLQ